MLQLWLVYPCRCTGWSFWAVQCCINVFHKFPTIQSMLRMTLPPGDTQRDWQCFMAIDLAIHLFLSVWSAINQLILVVYYYLTRNVKLYPVARTENILQYVCLLAMMATTDFL